MNSATSTTESKAFDSVAMRLAAHGVRLVELADGTLLAGAHHLPGLHAAARMLRSIGGAR